MKTPFQFISSVALESRELPEEIVEAALLGLLRYYGHLDVAEVYQQLHGSQIEQHVIEQCLVQLVSRRRILHVENQLVYRSLSTVHNEELVVSTDSTLHLSSDPFFQSLKSFLPMMHPLRFGSPLIQDKTDERWSYVQYRRHTFERAEKYAVIITHGNHQHVMSKVLSYIQQFGVAVLRAHPWNLDYALALLGQLRLSIDDLEVQRKDVTQLYEQREVREVTLRLSSPRVLTRFYFADRLRHSGIAHRVKVERWRNNE